MVKCGRISLILFMRETFEFLHTMLIGALFPWKLSDPLISPWIFNVEKVFHGFMQKKIKKSLIICVQMQSFQHWLCCKQGSFFKYVIHEIIYIYRIIFSIKYIVEHELQNKFTFYVNYKLYALYSPMRT
jgi:hypothetical protein